MAETSIEGKFEWVYDRLRCEMEGSHQLEAMYDGKKVAVAKLERNLLVSHWNIEFPSGSPLPQGDVSEQYDSAESAMADVEKIIASHEHFQREMQEFTQQQIGTARIAQEKAQNDVARMIQAGRVRQMN